MALMLALRAMVEAATRQILAAHGGALCIADLVEGYRDAVVRALADAAQQHAGGGSEAIAAQLEARHVIVGVFDLVDLARSAGRPLDDVAAACARIDAALDLTWLAPRSPACRPATAGGHARARSWPATCAACAPLLQRSRVIRLTASAVARRWSRNSSATHPQDLAMLSAGLAEIRRLSRFEYFVYREGARTQRAAKRSDLNA